MAEPGWLPGKEGKGGQERREEERREEMRRGLQLWVWSGSLQPLCCPLSPSPLWTPQGTHALARPQEAESQDQANGGSKGGKGRIGEKKREKQTWTNAEVLSVSALDAHFSPNFCQLFFF